METEMQNIINLSPIRVGNNIAGSTKDADIDDHKYTSLKDLITHSPTNICLTYDEDNSFSNIHIRNQLLKQAASAYLQSTAILTSRNQNWVMRLWRKINNKAALQMYWRVYIRNPLRACTGHIFMLLTQMVNQVGGVWGGTRAPIS